MRKAPRIAMIRILCLAFGGCVWLKKRRRAAPFTADLLAAREFMECGGPAPLLTSCDQARRKFVEILNHPLALSLPPKGERN